MTTRSPSKKPLLKSSPPLALTRGFHVIIARDRIGIEWQVHGAFPPKLKREVMV
jgi:hypothetical protein